MKTSNAQTKALTPVPTKKPTKFHTLLIKIGKRNAIVTCSVLLIGAAVLLNWALFSAASDKKDGYPNYDTPTEDVGNTDTPTGTEPTSEATFFSSTQVSRQRARDEAIEVLQAVVDNADATDAMKTEAIEGIAAIATEMQQESNIESLITAKGFEQCVAVIGDGKVNIVVQSEELLPTQIAQINEVVYSQTGILPAGVTIITK